MCNPNKKNQQVKKKKKEVVVENAHGIWTDRHQIGGWGTRPRGSTGNQKRESAGIKKNATKGGILWGGVGEKETKYAGPNHVK